MHLDSRHIASPIPVVSYSDEEHDRLFAQTEDGSAVDPLVSAWQRFFRRYPRAQGIMRLSVVGFGSDRTQAFFYCENTWDALAGTGVYYLMVREGGSWDIKAEHLVWES